MLIWTCNAVKKNPKDQLQVQHSTNAKNTKYLHLGYKILLWHKREVLKTYRQYLKSTQTMLQSIEFCKDWVEHFYCQMSGSRPNQPNTMNLQIMDLRTGLKCEMFPSALIRGACSTFSFFSAFFLGFSKKESLSPGGLLTLYIPFQLILAFHLLIMQVTS